MSGPSASLTSEEIYLINLKSFRPVNYQNKPVSIWHRLPVSRRSSVFILLFLGQLGELRVVLTKRSSKLRNFPGHISFPGGKADNGLESEWQVARREMSEEIGLSEHNDLLMKRYGFTIDHLNLMPCYLSRTFSAVRPCIGFMNMNKNTHFTEKDLLSNLELSMNPGESSSIFSCPLKDFLYPVSEEPPLEALERTSHDIKWGGIPWSLRSYTFLQYSKNEAAWLKDIKDLSASEEEELDEDGNTEDEAEKQRQSPPPETKSSKNDLSKWGRLGSRRDSETNEKIYDVWGLTANILHDLAEICYRQKQPSEKQFGEEELIYSIWHYGNQMREKRRSAEEVKLIESRSIVDEFGFNDILPRTNFLELKKLYKRSNGL